MLSTYNIQDVYDLISPILPSNCNWYIAGGAATTSVPGDYDIYFHTEEDFNIAYSYLATKFTPIVETTNAITYYATTTITLQLIRKHFGTPQQILSNFDLNVCRNAILSDGFYYVHPTARDFMYLELSRLSTNSISRLIKYHYRNFPIGTNKFTDLIVYLLQDLDTEVEDYYEGSDHKTTHHQLLLTLFSCPSLTYQISKIIDKHSPVPLTDLYTSLVYSYTEYTPDHTQSEELQYLLSQYNPKFASDFIRDKYPEIFI